MLTEEPFTKPGTDYCIQEFFILRRHRNKHIGHGVLKEISAIYKGKYSLLFLEKNIKALYFWKSIYDEFSIHYEEGALVRDEINYFFHVFDV